MKVGGIYMDVLGKHFFSFVKDLGDCTMRSMFGGVGFFCEEAMFSLLIDEKLYIRGNHEIDDQFLALGCQRFRHVKKSVSVVINYFDVTELFEAEPLLLLPMIKNSILSATSERQLKNRQNQDITPFNTTISKRCSSIFFFCFLDGFRIFWKFISKILSFNL